MDIASLEEQFHIKDYLEVIERRRSLIIQFFATVVILVFIGSFMMKPVYKATATLLIDEESPNVLLATGAVALDSQSYNSYREYYQSQMEIITSINLATKVFSDLKLGETKEYKKAREPIKAFLSNVKLEPVRDTRLLKLSVQNTDRELAARIANQIADLYVKRNLYYISRNELMNLLKNEYLKLESRLGEYSKIYKEQHPEMVKTKAEIADLVDKIEKVKQASVDFSAIERDSQYALQGLKANNVSIIDPAEVPVVPIKPKKLLNLFLACVLGAFGGVGLAFFMEYLDDTIKDTMDIEKLTKWSFLGNIPLITGEQAQKGAGYDRELLAYLKPKDPVVEAYRAIRTSILLSATKERPVKTFVITSIGPQEGKTTTTSNLSITIAQDNKKLLLIDADMRKPRIHDIFKKENKTGLSNYLSGQLELDAVIQKTGVEGICLITAGHSVPNPSELLGSSRFREMVSLVQDKFDIIIIDSPPIAAVTDSLIIGNSVDGMVLIVENGKTPKRALPHISQLLEKARIRVIGAIMNKIAVTQNNYYYYSHYYGKS